MRTIVFDLDGTLVDTAPDLISTLNLVFAGERLPPVAYDDARAHDRRRRAPHDRASFDRRRPKRTERRARSVVSDLHRPLWRAYCRPLAPVSAPRKRAPAARRRRLPPRSLHQQA